MERTNAATRSGIVSAGKIGKARMTALVTAHAMTKPSARCSGIGSHAFGMMRTLSSCKAVTRHLMWKCSNTEVGEAVLAVLWCFTGDESDGCMSMGWVQTHVGAGACHEDAISHRLEDLA